MWAPAIRHHDGRFRIYYPDPDFGIYVTTDLDPRGSFIDEPLAVHLVSMADGLSSVGRRLKRKSLEQDLGTEPP